MVRAQNSSQTDIITHTQLFIIRYISVSNVLLIAPINIAYCPWGYYHDYHLHFFIKDISKDKHKLN